MTALAGEQYTEEYFDARYGPNREKTEWITLVLAVKENPTSERLERMAWTARRYQRTLIVILLGLALWIVFGMMSVCGKAWKQAKAEYGMFSRKIWLELKLALITAVAWIMYCSGCRI